MTWEGQRDRRRSAGDTDSYGIESGYRDLTNRARARLLPFYQVADCEKILAYFIAAPAINDGESFENS
jgi:hypothetical protein